MQPSQLQFGKVLECRWKVSWRYSVARRVASCAMPEPWELLVWSDILLKERYNVVLLSALGAPFAELFLFGASVKIAG